VVVVDELDEGLQAGSLLNSLGAHLLCHFQWISFNSSNQSVRELLVLRKSAKRTYLLAAVIVVSNDDGLLSSMSSCEHNAHSASLHTNAKVRILPNSIPNQKPKRQAVSKRRRVRKLTSCP